MIEIFIQKEHIDRDEVRYYAVGKYKDNKFTGSVFGYEGGGVHGHTWMVDGKYIPQVINGECLEWEDMETIFEQLSGMKSNDLEEAIEKYVVLDTTDFPYFKAIYGTDSGLENNLVFSTMDKNPPSYANTFWDDTEDIKEFTIKELRSANNEKINQILNEIEGKYLILTDEQNKIIEAMKRPDCKLIKINAVSGAGKSSTLVEIAKALNVKSGLYISYNKAIATEASEKFSAEVLCKTIHSLAYGYTMSSFPLRLIPTLKARMITESIPAIRKSFLVDILSKYMLSREITIADFVEKFYKDKVSEDEVILMRDYFIKMKEGKIECSHDFYLKLFHILMHHKIIKTPEYDILMMDESGDITGVSLEIFKLIRANKKVMVGDSQQNIYSFNQTINGFEALSDEGEQLTLSQSFRVSTSLAPYVKEFCNTYLDPHMEFDGFPYKAMPDQKDITMFYIARTNSGIISRMIELDLQGRRYNLTRPVYSIFALPLLLLRLNKTPDSEIREPEFKFLEADMKEWMTNPEIRKTNESPLAYILSQHSDDTNITSAMNLLRKFSPWQIIQTYQNAKSHEKSSTTYKITITSAHSSKGLQADIVQIEPDLNEALHKVIEKQQNAAKERMKADREIYGDKFEFKYERHALFNLVEPDMSLLSKDAIEEFRLYYVAITRAKFQLQHAEWLTNQEVLTTTISMMHSRGSF